MFDIFGKRNPLNFPFDKLLNFQRCYTRQYTYCKTKLEDD